ncbi:HEAT repeat domain-containing protein [Lentibacillus saliphilus]|uniref:HEAT repeat domain-containing protein n=1 Tax=Lentibacillus saliphilus TaxID=2737028 RepID=UPI001C3073FD|nr:HEAT repeat domain-containing protein [Lentibacillus saliphilus]
MRGLIWTVAGISALLIIVLFILLGYLLIQRTIESRRNKRVKQYKAQFVEHWLLYLLEGVDPPEGGLPQKREAYVAIDDVFYHYCFSISDHLPRKRVRWFVENYMVDFYKKKLLSSRWDERLNALHRITDLQLQMFVDDVRSMLRREDKVYTEAEYVQMYVIMAKFDVYDSYAYLQNPQVSLNVFHYTTILNEAAPRIFNKVITHFNTSPLQLKLAIIDVIGLKKQVTYIDVLETNLQSDDEEIRIRSLKAIDQIGFVKEASIYAAFAQSDRWPERLMAARIFLHIPNDWVIDALFDLLRDPSWWVRKRAAETLSQKHGGTSLLQDVINQDTDPYAIDQARAILARQVETGT